MSTHAPKQPADRPRKAKAKPVRAFFGRRLSGMTRRLNTAVGYDEQGNVVHFGARTVIGHMFATIGDALRATWRFGRDEPVLDVDEQRRLYETLVLQWGGDATSRERMRRNLRLEVAAFFLIGLYGLYWVIAGLTSNAASSSFLVSQIGLGALTTLYSITRIALGLWRLDVLSQRRWRPFWHWLRGS